MEILFVDGKVAGYLGRMLKELEENARKNNCQFKYIISYENIKTLTPEEYLKYIKFI